MKNYGLDSLVTFEPKTDLNVESFSKYVHGNNIEEISQELESAITSIESNGNPNFIFTRRNLQLAYIDRINYIMNEEQNSIPSWARSRVTSIKVSQSDIRTVAVGQLIELKKDIKKSIKRTNDKMSVLHLNMISKKIDKILDGKTV